MKLSGVVISVYLMAVLLLIGPPTEYVAAGGALATLSIIASIRESSTVASVTIIVLASVGVYSTSITNLYSLTALFTGVFLLLPVMVAVSRVHTSTSEVGGMRSYSSKKRFVVPFAYVGVIMALCLVFMRNELYSLYFYASGHTMLQIYLIIGLSVIVFLPLYEYLNE
ncbi:MAG TPA: hypothetical protein ENN11_03095 [Methanomicrobia archaeon]|nr:hypothetical protein [Methanomicrobia archaeon]